MRPSLIASVFALFVVGCVELDPLEEELGTSEQGIHGLRWRGGVEPDGLVQVRRLAAGATYPQVHTGLVVAKDAVAGYELVLTSERWIPSSTPTSQVTIVDDPLVHGPSRTARFLNDSAFFPGAVVQVAHFSDTLALLDTRSSSALVGRTLRCFEYSNQTTLQYVNVRVSSYDGDTLTATYAPVQEYSVDQYLQDGDAGAMCQDVITEAFVGFVEDANTVQVTLHRIAGLSGWLQQLQQLGRVRTRSGNARAALYNTLASPMCADVPWASPYAGAAVQQYPCHHGNAQRFWLDYSLDANRPRLVSDSSGLCVDVPGASTASGVNLQQYGCNTGGNQRFELTLWNDAAGGWKVRPVSGLAANLCVSVEGGASPSAAPMEQRACAGPYDQRWFLTWL